MKDQKIEKMISQLPPELSQEVEDFVAFLSTRYMQKISSDKIKFEWEGSLEGFGGVHNTIDFQNTMLEWWEADNVSN
jgi:hypothetical protein